MAPPDIPGARQAAQQRNSASSVAQAPARSEESSPQRRNDESWVEVTSQPSSSSLSSIGDEIVTTGLRVGNPSYPPRRRRSQQQHQMPASFIVGHPATQGGATSSQDEYDETESEEDRVLTSSTEAIHPSANLLRQQTTVRAPAVPDTESDSDDDESATALGRPTNTTPVFRPQPNAFSHPPSHRTHRHSTGSAPYHHHQHHSSQSRPQMPNRPHAHSYRGSPNYMSPSYQADNDAALRASLTTLLSCAAAARGLPKHDERRTAPATGAGVVPSSQPMELRLVPEAELMAADDSPAQPPPPPPPTTTTTATTTATATATNPASKSQARTASNSSAPSAPSSSSSREKQQRESKRTAATQSRPARATKKKRISAALADGGGGGGGGGTAADGETTAFLNISPTLLTWVVSAGVVVLVSVVGFGAGYVIGREVGRQEGAAASLGGGFGGSAAAASGANASSATAGCGGELVRAGSGSAGSGTLRRLRWGAVGKSVAA
ncbi:uncharacterized protein P884DRAFT_284116 [Thermothelomyces heterothallicus CBS 202.75]|uniref:uncharacterized protein n=1 Tax=Thermothelomyces heterothallicus CBS 202.75 TaxID=1149848 RepID=UPI0037440290